MQVKLLPHGAITRWQILGCGLALHYLHTRLVWSGRCLHLKQPDDGFGTACSSTGPRPSPAWNPSVTPEWPIRSSPNAWPLGPVKLARYSGFIPAPSSLTLHTAGLLHLPQLPQRATTTLYLCLCTFCSLLLKHPSHLYQLWPRGGLLPPLFPAPGLGTLLQAHTVPRAHCLVLAASWELVLKTLPSSSPYSQCPAQRRVWKRRWVNAY